MTEGAAGRHPPFSGTDFHHFISRVDQFHMIARRSHALIEINAALARYIDSSPACLSASETSLSRYAEIGTIVCQNTQVWMAIARDLRRADHSLDADMALRLRGLAKMAAACGLTVLKGRSALRLLVEINLHGLANLQEAMSELVPATSPTLPPSGAGGFEPGRRSARRLVGQISLR
jgi:hypothetical protein